MSHFTVVVIGDDFEAQLAPYDEEIQVEPYKDYVDLVRPDGDPAFDLTWAAKVEHLIDFCSERGITRDDFYNDTVKEGYTHTPGPIQQEFAALHQDYVPTFDLHNPTLPDLKRVAALLSNDEERYGADEDGLYRWTSYNPQSKWDWYQVGGRWQGFFPIKEKAKDRALLGDPSLLMEPEHHANPDNLVADQVRKGDVDFERARRESREGAEEEFDKYWDVIKDHPDTLGWSHFVTLVEADELDIEQAREQYRAQPGKAALEVAKLGFLLGCPIDEFGMDRDAYIQRCVDATLVPYAIVHNGEWHQRSQMGWWGVSYDERMSENEWNAKVQELYDSLDDDELLTAVDCHI